MHGKEGIEPILELRRTHPGVPIIDMSGGGRLAPAGYLRVAAQAGARRVLAKPFSADELATAINEVLAGNG